MTSVTREEMQVRMEGDGLAFRTKEIGGQTIAHWGYTIKGRLQMRTTAGDQVYEAGDAFYWPPGHVPVAPEDCEYLDVSPTDQLEAVIGHVTGSQD